MREFFCLAELESPNNTTLLKYVCNATVECIFLKIQHPFCPSSIDIDNAFMLLEMSLEKYGLYILVRQFFFFFSR